MRLTKLEIKGFKSFADKTVIHFNDNITGIVGPNGCGKSNVVDSIRWVLGEQKTSQLRLEKMDNIIFNGTKSRKAAGLAEVALTFENTKNLIPTEYSSVTITRKLFRDGESEYRINDVQCRLKDIYTLFMDTGIGTDSYAIIELGMVDEILQDRDNSRRKLFEQAAGVSKYKIRKKETLSKLKGTEEDLLRLDDLLFEIEKNLKTLESQAKKAERYVKIKEEYKTSSLDLTKYKLQNHKVKYQNLKESNIKEGDNKIALDSEISLVEANLQKLKLANVDHEKALSDVQKKLNELIGGLGAKENERNLLKEQIKFADEKLILAQAQSIEAEDMMLRLSTEVEQLSLVIVTETSELRDIEGEFETISEQLQVLKNKNNTTKSEIDEDKKIYSDRERHIIEYEKNLAIHRATIESLRKEYEQHVQERLFKNEELENLRKLFEEVSAKKADQELQHTTLSDKETSLNHSISELGITIERSKHELTIINRKLDASRNEYNLTKSMIDNMEGFPEAIKFLKKTVKSIENVPLLSDIISCKEEYKIPIENYLESYLSYFVVDTVAEAVNAVNLLSDSAKGKANFFILEKIDAIKMPSLEIKDGLITAIEIMDTDSKYLKLIQHLLSDVYLGEGFGESEAQYLSSTHTVLSKSGKYIYKPISITGGSVGLFEGKQIGRVKNLDKLKENITELEKDAIAKERQIAAQQEELLGLKNSSQKDAIHALQSSIQTVMQEYTKLHTNIQTFAAFVVGGEAKLKATDEQIQALIEKNKSIESELIVEAEAQQLLKNKIEISDRAFIDFSNEFNEVNLFYNQKNIALVQKQNDVKQKQQTIDHKQNQYADYVAQMQKSATLTATSTLQIEENKLKLKDLESELLSKYDNRTDIEKETEEAERNYYKSRGEISEVENDIREKMRKRDLQNQIINDIQNKLNELKLDINSVKERLQIEFGVDINELLNQSISKEMDESVLEEAVSSLKKKLEGFGEVNPMAIEAYNEIKERYYFIVAQKNDLLNAKKNLLSTIAEIDRTAKDQFMEAFVKVRENFIKTFRVLFTEDDDCDLLISDTDSPLDANIDIIAKPKGKRPLSISQLSGGEKTLTATALLFSLYLLKPAPFCIFDEVDAPLDDTNIAKFNNIIQKFSQESQFIIVTHNKATMASVDVIYGVTMAEQGVSKVVPVDFRSLE
jgi:chromosome segregation protein